MASASSTSAKNLFQDSKRRLAERVQVNVNNVGSVTRQVQRGSRSHDMLAQTARNFCQTETTMENTFNNLQKMQVLMAQLNQQENSMDDNLRHLPDIREQIRDMQRYFFCQVTIYYESYALAATSLSLAFLALLILAVDLLPKEEPPQCFLISSALSL